MTKERKVLIIGSEGQDGYYLREFLIGKKYKILGVTSQRTISYNFDIQFKSGSILDVEYCNYLINEFLPDEVYYFAAIHQASNEAIINEIEFYNSTINVNAIGYLNLLQASVKIKNPPRFFYASSSHIFANSHSTQQNENTKYEPNSIYGISKVLGMNFSDLYRNKGIYCVSGIFYNHESPLRQSKFVSKKIISQAVDIFFKKRDILVLGDLNTKIDWGFAPDYINAAFLTLQNNESSDFIISSGHLNSVNSFVEIAFNELGLDWTKYIEIDQNLIKKNSTTILYGDNSKLIEKCNWKQTFSFEEMIKFLVKTELSNRLNIS